MTSSCVQLVASLLLLLLSHATATSKFAFVYTGVLQDSSINAQIDAGFQQARADYGVTVTYVSTSVAAARLQPDSVFGTIVDLVATANGVTHVVFAGPQFRSVIQLAGEVQSWTPGTDTDAYDPSAVRFSIIDAVPQSGTTVPSNTQYIAFRGDQGAFLAGVIAGYASSSKIVGVIAGEPEEPTRQLVNGFAKGINSTCPTCVVVSEYVYDTSGVAQNGAAASMATYMHTTASCDVILVAAAGASGAAALNESALTGVWVIGSESDAFVATFGSGTLPGADRVLTSVIMSLRAVTEALVHEDVNGQFRGGTTWQMDLANTGVALAPCHDACAAWNHVANLVATTSAGLQAGTQLTGVAASGAVERSYAPLNEWRQVAVLSPRMPPTKGFASTHVMDAAAPRLWLYGGISAQGSTSAVYVFDALDLAWRQAIANVNTVRVYGNGSTSLQLGAADATVLPVLSDHSAVALDSGDMVLFGGRESVLDIPTANVWVVRPQSTLRAYNEVTLMTSNVTGDPVARYHHSALSVDDVMLVFGGRAYTGERLNDVWRHTVTGPHPDNHTWTQLVAVSNSADAPSGRALASFTRVGTQLVVFGGQTLDDTGVTAASDAWALPYTCATTTSACVWRRLAVGPERRYGHAAVFVPLFRSQDANNLVTGHEEVDLLVAQGGFTTAGTVASSTMVYNASSNTWASHTTAAPALAEHTAVTLDGQVWVFGGVGEGGATVSQLWTYNFAEEDLCDIAKLTGCSGHGTCTQQQGEARCVCALGWTGASCTDCLDGFFRSTGDQCTARTLLLVDVSMGVFYVVCGTSGLCALVTMVVLARLCLIRRRRELGQHLVPSHVACVGLAVAIALVASISLAAPVESTLGACVLRQWLFGLATTAVLSVQLGRTFRLYAMFYSPVATERNVRHGDWRQWRTMAAVVVVALLVLVAWAVVEPSSSSWVLTELSPANHVLTPHCALSTVFMTTAAAVFGLALACSTYFARLGLRLPSVLYEGRHLWIAALAGWAWVAVGGLLVVLVQDNDAAALIRGIVLQMATMSTCGYLLIARLVTVVQPRDAGRLQRVLRLQASPEEHFQAGAAAAEAKRHRKQLVRDHRLLKADVARLKEKKQLLAAHAAQLRKRVSTLRRDAGGARIASSPVRSPATTASSRQRLVEAPSAEMVAAQPPPPPPSPSA